MVVARDQLRRRGDLRLTVDEDVDLRERREGEDVRQRRALRAETVEGEQGERRAAESAASPDR